MRKATCGAVAIVGLAALTFGGLPNGTPARAQRASGPASFSQSSDLLAFCSAAEQGQTLVVIDSRERSVGVYHVDAKGEIALRSVRNIDADLKLTDFNGTSPLPNEVRSMLERGKAAVARKP